MRCLVLALDRVSYNNMGNTCSVITVEVPIAKFSCVTRLELLKVCSKAVFKEQE